MVQVSALTIFPHVSDRTSLRRSPVKQENRNARFTSSWGQGAYPAEEALKAELDRLPHKIVLNVNEVAKEVGSPRVANIEMCLRDRSIISPINTQI